MEESFRLSYMQFDINDYRDIGAEGKNVEELIRSVEIETSQNKPSLRNCHNEPKKQENTASYFIE